MKTTEQKEEGEFNIRTVLSCFIIILIFCGFLIVPILIDKQNPPPKIKEFESDKIELRQLINDTQFSSHSSSKRFLHTTIYKSNSKEKDVLKVFAKINNQYRVIVFDMIDVRIEIDNSISKPYIRYKYYSSLKEDIEDLINNDYYNYINKHVVVYCPEAFLPENLIPINLDTP